MEHVEVVNAPGGVDFAPLARRGRRAKLRAAREDLPDELVCVLGQRMGAAEGAAAVCMILVAMTCQTEHVWTQHGPIDSRRASPKREATTKPRTVRARGGQRRVRPSCIARRFLARRTTP